MTGDPPPETIPDDPRRTRAATTRSPTVAELFYDDDADLSIIQGRKVAVIGYGSQGHAHALNLRDSGVDVRVGLPEGSKSRAKAEAEGLRVVDPADGVRRGRPDHGPGARPRAARPLRRGDRAEPQAGRRAVLRPRLQHPLRLHQPRRPTSTSCMVAPKGPGHLVRREYVGGRGVPVHRRRRAGRHRATPGRWPCRTPRRSAACAPAASRPRSPRRPRPTCSASRPCCAAAPRSWCSTASRRSSRPATSPRSPTSSACTSSSSSST